MFGLVHSLRVATKATALPLRVLTDLDQLEWRVVVDDDDTWSVDEMWSLIVGADFSDEAFAHEAA
jgi:hypothetical protein